MENAPTHLYVGTRAAVIAELGAPDFYAGKYYLAPHSSAHNFIVDGCDTRKEVAETVKAWRKDVPGITVVYLD